MAHHFTVCFFQTRLPEFTADIPAEPVSTGNRLKLHMSRIQYKLKLFEYMMSLNNLATT